MPSRIDDYLGIRFKGISTRESQVLDLLAEGLTQKEIAERLHITVKTVECHTFNASQKTGLNRGKLRMEWLRSKLNEGFPLPSDTDDVTEKLILDFQDRFGNLYDPPASRSDERALCKIIGPLKSGRLYHLKMAALRTLLLQSEDQAK